MKKSALVLELIVVHYSKCKESLLMVKILKLLKRVACPLFIVHLC